MATQLDVYRDWLGIAEPKRPLNYYQLLRLPAFEDDPAKIRAHYRKLNTHVRKYAAGDYAKQSQELLNELAKAMLCLTDRTRKGEYDASIGREQPGKDRKFSFEQLLLGRKVIDAEQLKKARDYANALNIEVREAIILQKMASQEAVMQIYAESVGLPYVDVAEIGVNEELVPQVPALLARKYSFAPIMVDGKTVLLASPNMLPPEVEDELRLRLSLPVRNVLCTTAGINQVINQHFPREAAAAQMASGPQKAAAKNDSPAAAAKSYSPEDIAERKKQRNLMTIMGFNFTFMIGMVATQVLGLGFAKGALIAVPAAAMVAVVVYLVKK